ncbi:hypothetical protein L227DRAFT_386417 [Lentinus tigrinus ALCF2SS1-6]|uniref:Uncharacterized protein n=1 Tax=Lentinus tigrinus ALCF2SS1-6 TaxID=1328759 RepID=A0A5C2SI27_9APHY|nr:hypothetical protein L227DRAFT_386417 [Lentinus tigrinus ALCF2SS1-6]
MLNAQYCQCQGQVAPSRVGRVSQPAPTPGTASENITIQSESQSAQLECQSMPVPVFNVRVGANGDVDHDNGMEHPTLDSFAQGSTSHRLDASTPRRLISCTCTRLNTASRTRTSGWHTDGSAASGTRARHTISIDNRRATRHKPCVGPCSTFATQLEARGDSCSLFPCLCLCLYRRSNGNSSRQAWRGVRGPARRASGFLGFLASLPCVYQVINIIMATLCSVLSPCTARASRILRRRALGSISAIPTRRSGLVCADYDHIRCY